MSTVSTFVSLGVLFIRCVVYVFFKQKTAYEMRISDWSSDVCSSDLRCGIGQPVQSLCELSYVLVQSPLYRIIFHFRNAPRHAGGFSFLSHKIGRASCRERVCQYV